jgi:acetoin utilization protein AcuB
MLAQRLITIKDDQTLEKALILMLKYNIRHLPVVDHTNTDKLVGIITERDLRLAAASPVIDPDLDLKEMMRILSEHKVSEVMQPVLYTVTEDESILAACKIMRLSKRGSLPILQKDTEKLMGIITQTDLLDHLIRVLEPLNSQP